MIEILSVSNGNTARWATTEITNALPRIGQIGDTYCNFVQKLQGDKLYPVIALMTLREWDMTDAVADDLLHSRMFLKIIDSYGESGGYKHTVYIPQNAYSANDIVNELLSALQQNGFVYDPFVGWQKLE